MSVNGLGAPRSALQTNQFRQDVTANNIANINTDGFRASTVTTADSAYINSIGTGTQVTGTYAPPRPGPLAMDTTGTAQYAGATSLAGATPPTGTATGAGMTELSNTDMITERTNQMSAQSAYSANFQMARSIDQTTQTLLDLTR